MRTVTMLYRPPPPPATGLLEDFGDEVADLVDLASSRGGPAPGEAGASARGASLHDLFAKQKVRGWGGRRLLEGAASSRIGAKVVAAAAAAEWLGLSC